MQNPRLAARYAKSILDLAVEQNQLEATLSDMKLLEKTSNDSPEFGSVLRSPVIKSDKKLAIIDAVLGNHLSVLTKSFITLLVNKGREANLNEIASAFVAQYKEKKNIKSVKLTTATQVTDEVKQRILQKCIASLSNCTVELQENVNPDIVGGFILEMDDKLFDASIRRDLNDVRAQFLKNIYVSQIR